MRYCATHALHLRNVVRIQHSRRLFLVHAPRRDRAGCTRHYTSIGIRTVFRCTVALHCRAPSPLWRPRRPATYLLRGGRHAHATRATGGLRRTPRAWAAQEIYALEGCHQSNPYAKFWGVCNDHKLALDRCFKAEVRRGVRRMSCWGGAVAAHGTVGFSEGMPDVCVATPARGAGTHAGCGGDGE